MGFVFAEGGWTRGDSRVLPFCATHPEFLPQPGPARWQGLQAVGRATLDALFRSVQIRG